MSIDDTANAPGRYRLLQKLCEVVLACRVKCYICSVLSYTTDQFEIWYAATADEHVFELARSLRVTLLYFLYFKSIYQSHLLRRVITKFLNTP